MNEFAAFRLPAFAQTSFNKNVNRWRDVSGLSS